MASQANLDARSIGSADAAEEFLTRLALAGVGPREDARDVSRRCCTAALDELLPYLADQDLAPDHVLRVVTRLVGVAAAANGPVPAVCRH